MREIKFRAQRIDGERNWVYGFYYEEYEQPNDICYTQGYIVDKEGDIWQVDPKTVGRYIGLEDKNGKGIYEGDIARMIAEVFVDEEIGWKNFEYIGRIRIWASRGVVMRVYSQNGEKLWHSHYVYKDVRGYRSEVIGNIHENPELLEGK